MAERLWLPGDPVPNFYAASSGNPRFCFDSVAGRYIVLCFFGSAASDAARGLRYLASRTDFFDDADAALFGITIEPDDRSQARIQDRMPGIRYFWDFDCAVSLLFGALSAGGKDGLASYRPFTLILDPMLRVLASVPLEDPQQHNAALERMFASLPPARLHARSPLHAPVLLLPRVFEPEFCRQLVGLYERNGGKESGFMREVNGKTVPLLDDGFKRRKDFSFDGQAEFDALRAATRARIARRLVPEIRKAFQFEVTRIERFIVAAMTASRKASFAHIATTPRLERPIAALPVRST